MQKIIVNNKFNNKKVSDILYFNFTGLTKNTLYKAFRKKDIRINNIKISEDSLIYTNDEITVYITDSLLYKNIKIKKIYEDENILIVDKPVDIEVVGNNSLTSFLEKDYEFISPCHRLDRNTVGLILFAKNQISLNILLNKFKQHEIEKHYLAKVFDTHNLNYNNKNNLANKNNYSTNNYYDNKINYTIKNHLILKKDFTQTLTAYLFKDNKKSMVYISDFPKKGYVKIETSFTLIEKNNKENYCILDVELHTGKTHQIRAHLAHLGYPIIGDGKYGINEINKKFNFSTQQLCSYKLKFNFKNDANILNYLNKQEFKINV